MGRRQSETLSLPDVLDLPRKEVARLRRIRGSDDRRSEIEEITQRYSGRLPAQPRTPEAIVGYDENGLPQ